MKVLFVTAVPLEYSSSANMRNIALIRGMIENGCEVSTLSTRPQIESLYYDGSILDISLKERIFVELGEVHAKVTPTTGNNAKKKIINVLYKVHSAMSLYDSRKNEVGGISKIDLSGKTYDVIVSSSDPKSSHLFAERIIKDYPGIAPKWIQYWGDPFSGDINRRSMIPESIVAKEEKRLISLCDKAVYVSPMTCSFIAKKYPEYSGKIKFLPIGYSKDKIYPLHISDSLDICYCGDYFTKDRSIVPLIDAVENLCGKCKLVIAGNSNVKLVNTENVSVLGRVSKQRVDEIEKNSDVIVCICNKSGTQIPGKIYHAAGTNRTVLIVLEGENSNEMREYFEDYNRFHFCDNTAESIANTLVYLKTMRTMPRPCERLRGYNVAKEFLKD